MTIQEKIKFINECKEKKYLCLSPTMIDSNALLISGFDSLNLYEKMEENTNSFAEREIVDLISNAERDNEEKKKYIDLSLIFEGEFKDLPEGVDNPIEIIMSLKDKLYAIYRYVTDTEEVEFYCGWDRSETVYHYGYLILSLPQLLEEFEKNGIKYNINVDVNRSLPPMCRDDRYTKFEISYCPKRDLNDEKGPQLKKVKKEN